MVYVLSDIHGNERRFNSVMKQIRLQPEDTLCVLGDVIDRHPGGIRILRQIMDMPNAKMILGNHEYMMLRALGCPYDDYRDDGRALEHWYRNGGKVTHDHLKRIRKTLRREIVEYLQGLPLCIDVAVNGTAYKLVHGAPAETYSAEPKYKNEIHYAVWKRLDIVDTFSKDITLVFGHTPTKYYQDNVPMEIWRGEHKIGIDCGSGYPEAGPDSRYGRLACLRLDDGKIFYSEESRV
jgi:serine/threonine protein phosphatase 1